MSVRPHHPRSRLDPSVRRQLILEAAVRVFADHDPNTVSLEYVAEQAGVSRSLVYSYFRDRGTLIAAAYTHELEGLDSELDAALASIGTDRDRLQGAVTAYLDFASRNSASWELVMAARASRHPAIREAADARVERIVQAIGASSDDARVLVTGVLALVEAAVVRSLELEHVDPRSLAELLTRLLWTGVSSLLDLSAPDA